jgi:Protein of unknown function (DUF3800)
MPQGDSPYEYILYIDEAGDDGLKRVRPIDEVGATEWLVLGGVLIRHDNERNVVDWVRDIRSEIDATQGPALHFRNLSPTKKLTSCQLLAQKDVVCFAVCSNKKNMRGWTNERAAVMGGRQWFYNFCVRFLMERATDLCFRDSVKRYGFPRYLKVVFSQRGGHSYGQTKAYWEHLKAQAASHSTYLDKWVIKHQVLRFNLVDYVPHNTVAGLQLADVVASAFYQAVDMLDVQLDVAAATALAPKMARREGVIADYGVVLRPTPIWKARLETEQKQIFRTFGYNI